MRPLGKRQIETLIGLASPASAMVIGNAVTAALARRGLVALHGSGKEPNAMVQITPSGLRALADAWEAGKTEITTPDTWKGGK